jgi:hypothetical protein
MRLSDINAAQDLARQRNSLRIRIRKVEAGEILVSVAGSYENEDIAQLAKKPILDELNRRRVDIETRLVALGVDLDA